jgi:hypothetical protein
MLRALLTRLSSRLGFCLCRWDQDWQRVTAKAWTLVVLAVSMTNPPEALTCPSVPVTDSLLAPLARQVEV